MDQIMTGNFIARKRKEKNLTQAALAERLGVSNKTVSKWETGKCMPDYSVIELLCKELEITVAELLDGDEKADKSVRVYDDTQVLGLVKRIQVLEQHRTSMVGLILIIMGIALRGVTAFLLPARYQYHSVLQYNMHSIKVFIKVHKRQHDIIIFTYVG